MNGPRRVVIDFVNLAFTLICSSIVAHATNAQDRWFGVAGVVFFGGGFAFSALIRRANRGLKAALSPALRLDDSGARLDRLELFIAPVRMAIYFLAAQFFLAAGSLCLTSTVGFAGIVVAILAFVLAGCGLFVCAMVLRLHAPIIVLDVDSLTYWRAFRATTTVRYSDIADLRIFEIASQRFVTIQAISVAAMVASADESARRSLLSNVRWTGAPHVLPNLVAPSAEQLIALITPYINADRQRRNLLALDGDCVAALPMRKTSLQPWSSFDSNPPPSPSQDE